MLVNVGLITWGPENGDVEEFIVVTNDAPTARRALVAELISAYDGMPSVFGDDAPEFMDGVVAGEGVSSAIPQKDLDHAAASDEELVAWLADFREATTAPWWTITETAIVE
ncbi:MAG: hypothetical protein ABWX92_11965 [Mycetocola sp.]